jgi:hypothetical protein
VADRPAKPKAKPLAAEPDIASAAAPAPEPASPQTAAADSGEPEAAPTPPSPLMAPPGPTSVQAPAPTGDLATLRDRWSEVVARVSANPPAKPLIVECRPVSVEDNLVTLGFPESKAFLKDLLEKRRAILEESVSAVLGRSVAVRCVATNIDVLPELPSDDEAAWILAEARRIFGEEGADPAEVG